MSAAARLIFLAGPTACGKSAVAAALAHGLGGEVICADAFQLYAGLPVLTAQPAAAERLIAPHHLYGTVPPTEEMSAARWVSLAESVIAAVMARGRVPIITGGSGLYLKALSHGLSPLPPAAPALRAAMEYLSPGELAVQLLALDPDAGSSLNLRNPRHVSRALEISLLTGQPASALKQSFRQPPRPDAVGVRLVRDRTELNARIDARTRAMIDDGVLDEVRALDMATLSPTAQKVIGLAEFRAAADGAMPLADAVAKVQQATRRYAKRQESWFRRESWMHSLPAADIDFMLDAITRLLAPSA